MTKSNRVTPTGGSKLLSGYNVTDIATEGAQKTSRTFDKAKNYRRISLRDRFLDAIYFIAPDCSCVQCLAILLGLTTVVILTFILLYSGGFWNQDAPR